jgi:hypothetical protein
MVILELFKSDDGDDEIAAAVRVHLSSRLSRIRRIAARALVATIPANRRRLELKALSGALFCGGWNGFHGAVLAIRAIVDAGCDTDGFAVEVRPLGQIPPMARDDYVFALRAAGVEPGDVEMKSGSMFPADQAAALASLGQFPGGLEPRVLIPLLRRWGRQAAPGERLQELLDRVLSDAVLASNEAFSINAAQFLAAHLAPASIAGPRLGVILGLFAGAHSIALKAALLALVSFVASPDPALLARHASAFVDCAIDLSSRMTPVHAALASIADLLFASAALHPVAFLLAANDVASVRTAVLVSFAAAFGTPLLCENIVLRRIIAGVGEGAKIEVGRRWVRALEAVAEGDLWGEPLSLFVDEFFIPKLCLPGLAEATEQLNVLLPTALLRKAFIEIAKRF